LLTASRRSRGGVRPDQIGIGQPFADDLAHGTHEPSNVLGFPIVEPKDLLIEIPEPMERLDAHIGAFDPTLQQAPEVLQPVGVDLALGIALGVVNDLVGVLPLQSTVGRVGVGEHVGPRLDLGGDVGEQMPAFSFGRPCA